MINTALKGQNIKKGAKKMEIVQELQTRESVAKKAVAAFGFNQPNPEDVIHREDYDSDAEYAVALARMTQTMNSPEYRAAARKVGVTAQRDSEDEERKRQREEYKEIRKAVTLSDYELEQIDKEALALARKELASGKIGASELGAAVERIAAELTKKQKDVKAGKMQFNAMFRREVKGAE